MHTWISSPGSEIKRLFYTLDGKSYTTTINPQANDLLVSYSYDFSNVQVILGSNLDKETLKKVIEFSTWHINCTTKLEKSYNKTSIAEYMYISKSTHLRQKLVLAMSKNKATRMKVIIYHYKTTRSRRSSSSRRPWLIPRA